MQPTASEKISAGKSVIAIPRSRQIAASNFPRRMSRAERGVAIRLDQVSFARSLVSVSTVRNFERGRGVPQQSTLALMSRALQDAGIEFLNGDEPGVKLKKR